MRKAVCIALILLALVMCASAQQFPLLKFQDTNGILFVDINTGMKQGLIFITNGTNTISFKYIGPGPDNSIMYYNSQLGFGATLGNGFNFLILTAGGQSQYLPAVY